MDEHPCAYFVGEKASEECLRCGYPFHAHVREWQSTEPIRPWKKPETEDRDA